MQSSRICLRFGFSFSFSTFSHSKKNTHSIAALYETFDPQKAFDMASRLDIHYTPKHGSWLNIAEIELSALGRYQKNSRPRRIAKRAEALVSGS